MLSSPTLPEPGRSQSPGHHLPWKGLLTLFTLAGLIEAIFWGQLNAFVPLYLPALGVAPARVAWWTGLVTAIGSTIGILVLPLWGALADRYARKPVIVRSFAVYFFGCVLVALAGGVGTLVVGRTVMGLALGNSGLMMATLAERVPPRRAALVFGIFNAAPSVGAFMGPLLGGPLFDAYGPRALFATDAALLVLVAFALSVGYRDSFRSTERRDLGVLVQETLSLLFASPRLRIFFPTLFFLFGGWVLANLYLPLIVGGRFPSTELATRIGLVLASSGGATVVFAPAVGALADRKGVWPVLRVISIVETAAWILPAVMPTLSSFTIAWALANGLASSGCSLAFTALSRSAPANTRGRVMALAYFPSTAGFALAAALGSAGSAHFIAVTFPAAAVLTALGAAGVVLSGRQPSERAPALFS